MTKVQLQAEVERLKEKCDKQAEVIRRVYVEQFPDTYFVCGQGGEVDRNGLPERLHVCPAYGCDWSEIYARVRPA